jgi:hypothetical protein
MDAIAIFTEVIDSTLKSQERNILKFITQAVVATRQGKDVLFRYILQYITN